MLQVNKSYVWMVDDVSPRMAVSNRFLGVDMGSRPNVRPLLESLRPRNASVAPPPGSAGSQALFVSRMLYSGMANATLVVLVASVYEVDPSRLVVSAAFNVDEFVAGVRLSPDVMLRVTGEGRPPCVGQGTACHGRCSHVVADLG